jgi:hypothetical protein
MHDVLPENVIKFGLFETYKPCSLVMIIIRTRLGVSIFSDVGPTLLSLRWANVRWPDVGPLFHFGFSPTLSCLRFTNGHYDIGPT